MDIPSLSSSHSYETSIPAQLASELEMEAEQWTYRAQAQSQSAVWALDVSSLPPLASEPPRAFLVGRGAYAPLPEVSLTPGVILCDVTSSPFSSPTGEYFVSQVQSRAGEDRGQVQIWRSGKGALMLVLDGHSPSRNCRKGSADLAYQKFGDLFFDLIGAGEHPLRAFREVMSSLQESVKHSLLEDGTTITACYHDNAAQVLWGAALGDSPATLYAKTTRGFEIHRLTYLESWTDPQAQARVPRREGWHVNHARLFRDRLPGLAVTRALGDLQFSPAVSQEPIPFYYRLDGEHQFIVILATDGVWDWLTEVECGKLMRNWCSSQHSLYRNYSNPAELLIAKARERAHAYLERTHPHDDPNGIIDDMTVVAFIDHRLLSD